MLNEYLYNIKCNNKWMNRLNGQVKILLSEKVITSVMAQ